MLIATLDRLDATVALSQQGIDDRNAFEELQANLCSLLTVFNVLNSKEYKQTRR